MTLCPVAMAVGCKKCPAFSICPLKGVIGDYTKADAPEKKPGTWRFDMRVRGLDPVAVQLTIGDDVGSTIAVDRTAR